MSFKTLVIVLYVSNELLIDALYIKLFFVPRQVVTTPRKPLLVVFHLCFRFACFEYFYHCLIPQILPLIHIPNCEPSLALPFIFYLLPPMVLQWYSLSCESSLLR